MDCCIFGAKVSQGQRGPGGLGSWASRQSSASGPQSLAASLGGRGLAGEERQGTEKMAPAPQSAVGPLRAPTLRSPPHSPTLKDVCDGPALTRSSEAGPASALPPCYRPGLPDPEPPVRAPWTSAWVPSRRPLRLSAEVPGGVITSQAFWVSQGPVLVEETDFPCLCGLAHRLSLSCDLLSSPHQSGVCLQAPYSVQ